MGQGAFKLRNGLLLVSTEAPGGVYNSAQLRKIAELCDGETAFVKASEDQRLCLFVAPARLTEVKGALEAVGLGVRHYQDGVHQPVNCLGELCPDFAQDAMGDSMALARELAKVTTATPIKIGLNGCARCCVATHTLDVSIIGEANGYRISLGGKNSQIPEMASFMAEGVPAAKLPKLVAKVVSVYKSLAQKDESLQDVMERVGTKPFVDALAPYSQDAATSDDPFAGVAEETTPDGAQAMAFDASTTATEGDDGPLVGDDLEAMGESGPEVALADDAALDTGALDLDGLDDGLDTGEVVTAPKKENDMSAFDDLGELEDPAFEDAPIVGDKKGEGNGLDAALDDLELDADLEKDLGGIDQLAPMKKGEDDLLLADDADVALPVKGAPAPGSRPAGRGALTAVPTPTDVLEDSDLEDGDALEVGEDDADAFEAKLEESIAEEESMPLVEDTNAGARLAAVQLVESGGEFSDLEIERDIGDLDVDDEDLSEETFGSIDLASDDKDQLDSEGSSMEAETSDRAVAPAGSGRFELAGVDFAPDGKVALQFASGASIAVDPSTIKRGCRTLMVGKQRIVIEPTARGIKIDVDGLAVFLPKRAA